MSEAASSTVESIPMPPHPETTKSSKEILCELFGAFNAKPPCLDDIPNDIKSISSDKHHKKTKKHTKKKHKKFKKQSRSSSIDSSSSSETKKKSRKKHKKHKSKRKNSESDKKKKKVKLGKFSASDDDSNEPSKKLMKFTVKDEKLDIDRKELAIKKEKTDDGLSDRAVSIQDTILKHAVSKIVEKVIDSKSVNSDECIFKKENTVTDEFSKDSQKLIDTPSETLKKELFSQLDSFSLVAKIVNEEVSSVLTEKIDLPNSSNYQSITKQLSVADVFTEDLLDTRQEMENVESPSKIDKNKPAAGKIKIKNLKFSQVYEATVKKIEEDAKLKAEKYEDGEITDSSDEKERTSSEVSSCGFTEEIELNEKRHCKRKRSQKHHRSKESPHHDQYDKSRSRSREKHRHHSPTERHHSNHHREHKRSRSKNYPRDKSKDKMRERSRDRTRNRLSNKGKGLSRSRSRERIRSRDRRSRSRDQRSRSRDRRSRSRDRGTRSRDRRSRTRDRDSRSRSRERKKNVDNFKDKKKSIDKSKHSHNHSTENEKRNPEEKIDKQKLLEIARRNALNMMKTPGGITDQTKVTITAGGKTVNELTDFCKLLSKKEADGHESISSNTEHSSDSESEKPFHHPFQIRDRSNIVLNIRNSVPLPVKSHQEKTAEQSRQLRLQFPVSSGQQHRKTESEWVPVSPEKTETTIVPVPNTQIAVVKPNRQKRVFKDTPDPPKVDIGSIVSQRLEAMRRLQENPTDSEALTQMYRAQQNMKNWAESKQETGQFTGSTGVKVLSQAELSSGYQAWTRKDQLQAAAPVTSGMGMALLQKMGWRPGEGLGKNKEGTLQPLLLEVKMDKKGLVAQEELPVRQPHQVIRGPPRKVASLEGKHPVSLLNEYCSRRRYGPPVYELVDEAGPDHKKNFLFRVKVNGVEYKPAVGSPKKKQARAEAAEVCLKALGVLPNK